MVKFIIHCLICNVKLILSLDVPQVLAENDAYHALQKIGGLLITGPTGTNVNDLAMVLIWR